MITWTDGQVLRAMMGTQVTEEQLQSIATRAIQEADLDRDGAVSFDEFRKVGNQNLRPARIRKTRFRIHKRLFFACFQSMGKINLGHRMSVRFLR